MRRLIVSMPKNGGSRSDQPDAEQLDRHKKCDGFYDVYGRMSWNKVAPTITGGCFNPSNGRFLHPRANRNITMREAALLQMLPLHYTFPDVSNKQELALLIGNALPPKMIRRFALAMMEGLTVVNPPTSASDSQGSFQAVVSQNLRLVALLDASIFKASSHAALISLYLNPRSRTGVPVNVAGALR